MFIALRDLWRSKLRFGLLAGAMGLLIFLLLFLNTLSSTLLGFFVGAIANNSADVLVYDSNNEANAILAVPAFNASVALAFKNMSCTPEPPVVHLPEGAYAFAS